MYVKQKLAELKGETGKSTITVGDLTTLLSTTERTREKISRIQKEKIIANQSDLADFYRILQQEQNTLFPRTHETHYQVRQYLGPQNKLQQI